LLKDWYFGEEKGQLNDWKHDIMVYPLEWELLTTICVHRKATRILWRSVEEEIMHGGIQTGTPQENCSIKEQVMRIKEFMSLM
jgi:hypothetical protein